MPEIPTLAQGLATTIRTLIENQILAPTGYDTDIVAIDDSPVSVDSDQACLRVTLQDETELDIMVIPI